MLQVKNHKNEHSAVVKVQLAKQVRVSIPGVVNTLF